MIPRTMICLSSLAIVELSRFLPAEGFKLDRQTFGCDLAVTSVNNCTSGRRRDCCKQGLVFALPLPLAAAARNCLGQVKIAQGRRGGR
jgi:hypothetical protein